MESLARSLITLTSTGEKWSGPAARAAAGTSLRIRCEGGPFQLFVVANKDMAARIARRRPVDLATRRRPGRLDQGDAADLVVSLGREPRPNQRTTIIEQEHGIAAGSQMNARGLAIIGVGDLASGRRSQSLLSGTLCAPFF